MTSSLGSRWMKTLLTQGDIRWVCGDRKWMLSTTTVTQMLKNMNFESHIVINLMRKYYANIIQESENHEARNCIFCLSYQQHKVLLWEIVLQRNYPCSAQLFHKLHFSNINLSCRKDWFSPNKICLRGYLGGVVLRDHVFTAVCWWELHLPFRGSWQYCQDCFKHFITHWLIS